jgi:hypothetical protein
MATLIRDCLTSALHLNHVPEANGADGVAILIGDLNSVI